MGRNCLLGLEKNHTVHENVSAACNIMKAGETLVAMVGLKDGHSATVGAGATPWTEEKHNSGERRNLKKKDSGERIPPVRPLEWREVRYKRSQNKKKKAGHKNKEATFFSSWTGEDENGKLTEIVEGDRNNELHGVVEDLQQRETKESTREAMEMGLHYMRQRRVARGSKG